MLVSELIELLKKCDPNLPVITPAYGAEDGWDNAKEITEIYVKPYPYPRDWYGEFTECKAEDKGAFKAIAI